MLLVKQIKNQTAETKASREFFLEQFKDEVEETPVKKMAQTMQNFSSTKKYGIGMRGPVIPDRSAS